MSGKSLAFLRKFRDLFDHTKVFAPVNPRSVQMVYFWHHLSVELIRVMAHRFQCFQVRDFFPFSTLRVVCLGLSSPCHHS